MVEKNIDWENWEKNFQEKWAKIDLKNIKSGSISFLESQGKYRSREEQFHAHWDTYLTDYWKNWRERINNFQTEKEVNFYVDRLFKFIEFVEKYTRKDMSRYCGGIIEGAQQWDPINTPKLIEQELQRLETISEEEFRKTDKWSNSVEWEEMTIQEISDMLDYTPNADKKVDNFPNKPNDNQELNQSNSVEVQKDNKGIGTGGIIAIVGLVSVVVISGVIFLVRKRVRK